MIKKLLKNKYFWYILVSIIVLAALLSIPIVREFIGVLLSVVIGGLALLAKKDYDKKDKELNKELKELENERDEIINGDHDIDYYIDIQNKNTRKK
jgi:hypothetical protein